MLSRRYLFNGIHENQIDSFIKVSFFNKYEQNFSRTLETKRKMKIGLQLLGNMKFF